MGDEVTKLVLGDAAISAIEDASSRRGRFFGRKKTQRPPPTHCENCGAPLQGHWCAQCGQPAIDYRRSFRHVVADLLDEFLNWDSKFFTTIALLLVKPWKLTNEFLAGHRVRYVESAAFVSAGKHPVFLCGKLRSKRDTLSTRANSVQRIEQTWRPN